MINRKIGILSVILATGISCQNNEDTTTYKQIAPVGSTSEMVVKDGFNWSASKQGTINVRFNNPHNTSIENEFVHLINERDEVLIKTIVENGVAEFSVVLPQDQKFFIFLPHTGDKQAIGTASELTVNVSKEVENQTSGKTSFASCTVCASPFVNGNMETPQITLGRQTQTNQSNVPGWKTTATDGKIEIWSTGFNGVPSQEGNQFFEINATQVSTLYQELCLEPGSTIRWSVYHRGRAGVDVASVKIGATVATATVQATMTDGKTAWGYYTGTYVIPVNQTTTVFAFEAVSAAGGASVGNFIDNFRIECDKDGDGVKDSEDDYPNNPNKAYKSFFPTDGRQTVAFEDLWPSVGDYDFNDLVLNSKVEIAKNAANQLVDATFKISVDAIGAGFDNGIAMMLYKADKTAYGSDVIASVSGHATKDPANTNGLLISSNVFDDLSSYYQNNGFGPSKTSDTLSFTVVFKSGVTANVLPEVYLYRANERGLEVHMTGYPATATLNTNLVNSLDDAGNFKTATGLPWAIEVVSSTTFKHPLEKVDMLDAYSQFQAWAMSLGVSNTTWYLSPNNTKVFSN